MIYFCIVGKYSNIDKTILGNNIAGIKFRILFVEASRVVSCPELPAIKTTDDDYLITTGDFVFVDPVTDGFNFIEVVNRTGELKWKSAGTTGNLKTILELDFDYAGISSAYAKFLALAKNDNLILIIERTDCSGLRFLFGGCCLPAQMISYEGTTGKKPDDDIKTNIKMDALAVGLPLVLPTELIIPIVSVDDNIITEDDDDIIDEDDNDLIQE